MKVTVIAFLSGHCIIECEPYYPILFVSRANSHQKPHGAASDLRIPQLWKWGLTSSGMLRSVDWYLFTDVSGQPIDAIFKSKKLRPTAFPETSVTKQQPKLRNIPEDRMY